MASDQVKEHKPHYVLRGFSYALAGMFAAGLLITFYKTFDMLLGA